MPEPSEVTALHLACCPGALPLTDNAASLLLAACCAGAETVVRAELTRDPAIALWVACQIPSPLTHLEALEEWLGRQRSTDVISTLSSCLTTRVLDEAAQTTFRWWWLRAVATRRLIAERLAGPNWQHTLLDLVSVVHVHRPDEIGTLTDTELVGTAGLRTLSGHAWSEPEAQAVTSIAQQAAAEVDQSPESLINRLIPASEQAMARGCSLGLQRTLSQLLSIVADYDGLKRRFDERLETEKLLAIKELAYGASHEINNPLANISSRAQMLMRDEADPDRRRSLATINSQAFRAHEMIADMMLFAKPPALNPEQINLSSWLKSVVDEVAQDGPDEIEVMLKLDPAEIWLNCDPIQLRVAIRAICRNAVEAMDGSGRLSFGVTTGFHDNGSRFVEISIQDDGPGVTPEVRSHLFDPFYSGREAGRGLGFGLAKAWRIMQLHQGHIDVASQLGQGATFVLRFPVEPTPQDKSATVTDRNSLGSGK